MRPFVNTACRMAPPLSVIYGILVLNPAYQVYFTSGKVPVRTLTDYLPDIRIDKALVSAMRRQHENIPGDFRGMNGITK